MGDVIKPKRASLWREGLRLFGANWHEWMPAAIIFFLIITIVYAELFHFVEPMAAKLQAIKSQKDPQAIWPVFADIMPGMFGFIFVWSIVVYAQKYMFLSFFMKKELPDETEKPSIREFFCFLSKMIQLGFVVAIPAMAVGAVGFALGMIVHFLAAIGMIAAFLLYIYLIVGLYFAIPLAAAKIGKPLKNSWVLTRGNFWRLFGNLLMIILVFIGIFLVFIVATFFVSLIVAFVVKATVPQFKDFMNGAIGIIVRSAIQGVVLVLTSGVLSAYASAATRILYEEKHRADPNFVLTTRS